MSSSFATQSGYALTVELPKSTKEQTIRTHQRARERNKRERNKR